MARNLFPDEASLGICPICGEWHCARVPTDTLTPTPYQPPPPPPPPPPPVVEHADGTPVDTPQVSATD